MTDRKPKRIFLAPAPRAVNDIFDEGDLFRLRDLGDVVMHEDGPVTDQIFEGKAATAEIIIGQVDLPESRLRQASELKAVFNVEGNFLPNIDYGFCFRAGIRILNISPVFAEPVAEAALGMAIDLARGITRSGSPLSARQGGIRLRRKPARIHSVSTRCGTDRVGRSRKSYSSVAPPLWLLHTRL
jgi:phosphoglycerate dehydrogenase-like enzyme